MTQPDGAGGRPGDGATPAPWVAPDQWGPPTPWTTPTPPDPTPSAILYPPAASTPAPTTRTVVIGLVLLLLACAGGGLVLLRRATTGPADPYRHAADRPDAGPSSIVTPGQPQGPYRVSYEVTGTGRASVLYTRSASVTGIVSVTLPWRATLTLDADVGEVTLRALTPQAPPDGFACRLVVDGETVVDSTPDESGAVTCQVQLD
ncbi:MmpS family transport accessory protein [Micromonospora globispora]|uniref:MmpS family transport accessory protein n=1 Tax=Micromonospora globispora TaxID=1450148 RepID=UPI000F5D5627|nr:MmpS family transport accessory protein [Micromonospora globispora]RQW91120.1 hypothetical protein DKL51_21520 [Micromonospora globispora]